MQPVDISKLDYGSYGNINGHRITLGDMWKDKEEYNFKFDNLVLGNSALR